MQRLVKGDVNTATGPQGRRPIMRSQKMAKFITKNGDLQLGMVI